jgi:hypothetical protein
MNERANCVRMDDTKKWVFIQKNEVLSNWLVWLVLCMCVILSIVISCLFLSLFRSLLFFSHSLFFHLLLIQYGTLQMCRFLIVIEVSGERGMQRRLSVKVHE